MGEVVAAASGRCDHRLPAVFGGGGGGRRNSVNTKTPTKMATVAVRWGPPQYPSSVTAASATRMRMSAATHSPDDHGRDGKKPPADIVTFSSNVSTDVPLYEPPQATFDEYIIDRPRIFQAMFPDRRRSKRLNDEEWSIQMLPLQFLFASVSPVVVLRLRCKSHGQDYPPAVPLHVPRVLELQATRWELRGLDTVHIPSHFSLTVQGVLYAERRRSSTRLKGHLRMNISLVLPPLLALVPKDVLRAAAELVMSRLVKKMEQEVHEGLLLDFRTFGREKLMKHGPVSHPSASADQRGVTPKLTKPQS